MNLGTAEVIRANSRHLPIADDSVDLVVTSPPYFALRSYQDGGEHYAGQIGDEPTPAEFVASLLEVTRECVRVLKPSGSLWVNLGDKYSGYFNRPDKEHKEVPEGSMSRNQWLASQRGDPAARYVKNAPEAFGIPYKSLMGIPWRYALACIDDLGLILRAEVIWSKPNGLPESVTDRVRRSHEQWFHFTLEPRYFSAVDEIREAHLAAVKTSGMAKLDGRNGQPSHTLTNPQHALGKLPGSVWTIPTEPLRVPDRLGVDHFAAFPTEWPKRIIAGWSPAGVCVECGEGRRPVTARETNGRERSTTAGREPSWQAINRTDWQENVTRIITGYVCGCPELERGAQHPTKPAIVLDPFGGTGTTAMVAKALGRHGISVDMSADYGRLAAWRTNDRDQLAKVLGVAKAEQQDDGQMSMFELDGPAA